jgi:hypothetical protein
MPLRQTLSTPYGQCTFCALILTSLFPNLGERGTVAVGALGSSRLNQLVRRERQEADVIATPSGVLDRRALVAASRATRTTSKLVARSVRAPADHGNSARQRCMVLALFAPHPYPRRRTLQVAERWAASGLLPLGSRRPRLASHRAIPRALKLAGSPLIGRA